MKHRIEKDYDALYLRLNEHAIVENDAGQVGGVEMIVLSDRFATEQLRDPSFGTEQKA